MDNISSRGNCDFISRLPDPILCHILGLLNIKEAVQTCVLSKRWEHLWTSLSSLNIDLSVDDYVDADCDEEVVHGRFVKFVNTLLLRRKPLDLDVFRLSCDVLMPDYAGHVRDWILYAVNHNTRVLHLSLFDSVPCCIYTCTSLEELCLHYLPIDSSVQIVNLPNLRKLSIRYAVLNSNYVKNLLSGCTVLEFLRLESFLFSEIVIAHECLKHLAIVDFMKKEEVEEVQLLISAPNLLSFFYKGELSLPCKTTLNMPSLSFACLMSRDSSMIKCLEGIAACLCFLTNVELLELHIVRGLNQKLSSAVLPLELPIFPKLKNATVAFFKFSCFQMVIWILKSSPNLTKLTILQHEEKCLSRGEEGASTNESTNVSSTIAVSPYKKLKIIEVKYYRYNQMIRQLVDTLMDATKEFENLKIHWSKYKSSSQYFS